MASKRKHPMRYATFLEDYVHVTPATTLVVTEPRTGVSRVIADIPERIAAYKAGQVLEFGSVNAAKAFVGAMKGKARLGHNGQ